MNNIIKDKLIKEIDETIKTYKILKNAISEEILFSENISNAESFSMKLNFPKDSLDSIQKNFNKTYKNIVYMFCAKSLPDCCNTYKSAHQKFQQLNEENKYPCMSRVNKNNWEIDGIPIKNVMGDYCLYVGSCKDNSDERMKHHLSGLSKTFGLHLSEWWDQKCELQISAYVFNDFELGNIKNILQIIEDVLWNTYKPLFGRRGSK